MMFLDILYGLLVSWIHVNTLNLDKKEKWIKEILKTKKRFLNDFKKDIKIYLKTPFKENYTFEYHDEDYYFRLATKQRIKQLPTYISSFFFDRGTELVEEYIKARDTADETDRIVLHRKMHITDQMITKFIKNENDKELFEYVNDVLNKPDQVNIDNFKNLCRCFGMKIPSEFLN